MASSVNNIAATATTGGNFDQAVKKVAAKKGVASKKAATSSKRHANLRRGDNIRGITKPALRRIGRRAGVKRLSKGVYDEARNNLEVFMDGVLKDAIVYTQHSKRKTVTVEDITNSLKRNNCTLYGF